VPGSLGQQIALLIALNLGIGPFINGLIVGLGEEIGWRGFLYPRLQSAFGTAGLFIGGVIWALWHAPMIAYFGLNYPALPWWLATLYFALYTIPCGIILYAIYMRTGSIIAAAIAHAALDSAPVFAGFFIDTNKLNPLVFEAGWVSMLVLWILAALLLWYRSGRLLRQT
jgi:membrane protease YdiL (CAAX protease family)